MKKSLTIVVALGVMALTPLDAAGATTSTRTSSPAGIVSLSPRQIATISLTNARAKGSCTNVSHGASVGLSFGATTRSGAKLAEQTLEFNKSRGTALLIGATVYVRMSAELITLEFGRSAPQLANRWISIRPSDAAYSGVTTGMLFSSMLAQVLPAGTLSKSKVVTLDGVKVIAISGSGNVHLGLRSSKQTLFVAARAPYLPVALDAAGRSQGVPTTLTVTFSHWGKPLHLAAPTPSLPFASTTLAHGG